MCFPVATSKEAELFSSAAGLAELRAHDGAGGDAAAGSLDHLPAHTQMGQEDIY